MVGAVTARERGKVISFFMEPVETFCEDVFHRFLTMRGDGATFI
jgi:hypothetical protein